MDCSFVEALTMSLVVYYGLNHVLNPLLIDTYNIQNVHVTDYALKTNDKTKILERYEDRVSIAALYCADGDYEKAIEEVHTMMKQEYQPATPTFFNAGRKPVMRKRAESPPVPS